jgi:hypothetical protein
MKGTIFWDVTPCSPISLQVYIELLIVKSRKTVSSVVETLVDVYQKIWRHNPEDSNLHSHSRGNIKSYATEHEESHTI